MTDRELLGLGRGARSQGRVDLSLYRPWFLRASLRSPKTLKCFMLLAIVLSFVAVGPAESVWRLLQEFGRAWRNFSFYRAKKVWLDLPRTIRKEMADIETVRQVQSESQEAQ